MKNTTTYSAGSVRKAVQILRFVVRQKQPAGVNRIATKLGLNPSTTHGILGALREEGFVEQDGKTKRYRAGRGFIEFSRETITTTELPHLARPFLVDLAGEVGETVCLGVPEGMKVRVIEAVQPQKEFTIFIPVGTLFSVTTPALLKMFLGSLDENDARSFLSENPLPPYTSRMITDKDEMFLQSRLSFNRGYAVDLEEYRDGVRAITTAVLHGGDLKALLWINGLSQSLTDGVIPAAIRRVREAGARISGLLKQ